MLNSTYKKQKTMQNQHSSLENLSVNRFFDTIDFGLEHTFPSGSLIVNEPEPNLNWLHYHNFLEIGRCFEGSGTFCVENKLYKYQAPCCCIVYGGMYHSAQSNPYNKAKWNFAYLDLPYYLSKIDETINNSFKGLSWSNYSFEIIFSKNQNPIIYSIINAIFDEISSKKENSDYVISGLILSLLTIHSREMTLNMEKRADYTIIEKITPAISYVQSNYGEKITIEKLSSLCYVSNTSLRKLFQEFAKMSPLEYIHSVRIKHASILLLTTKKQIMDVAYECGYPTISSFNRKFFEHYKISPKEYRKQNKELK